MTCRPKHAHIKFCIPYTLRFRQPDHISHWIFGFSAKIIWHIMAQLFKEGKHARLCEYHNYCFVNGILGRHMLILAVY